MGNRGQILIEDTGVYLYTHWGANELPELVREAMRRGKGRWMDPEYLARIIFSEMIRDSIDGTTGYGIGTRRFGDVWRVIKVNCEEREVTIDDGNSQATATFEEFVDDLGFSKAIAELGL